MWAVYKCKTCKNEVNYFKSTPTKRCPAFIGKVQGYCQGELIEMDEVVIEEVKRQHSRPYQHGKLNNTQN
tara:strand:- start:1359 stop:1568 length:210 start_codon:yes stop_codon:yes gene_type:complete